MDYYGSYGWGFASPVFASPSVIAYDTTVLEGTSNSSLTDKLADLEKELDSITDSISKGEDGKSNEES